jgi:hypothetical protein
MIYLIYLVVNLYRIHRLWNIQYSGWIRSCHFDMLDILNMHYFSDHTFYKLILYFSLFKIVAVMNHCGLLCVLVHFVGGFHLTNLDEAVLFEALLILDTSVEKHLSVCLLPILG